MSQKKQLGIAWAILRLSCYYFEIFPCPTIHIESGLSFGPMELCPKCFSMEQFWIVFMLICEILFFKLSSGWAYYNHSIVCVSVSHWFVKTTVRLICLQYTNVIMQWFDTQLLNLSIYLVLCLNHCQSVSSVCLSQSITCLSVCHWLSIHPMELYFGNIITWW